MIDEALTLTDEEFRVEHGLVAIGPIYNDEGLASLIEANLDLWNAIGRVVTVSPPIFLAAAVAFGLLGPRDAAPSVEPTAST